MTLTSELRPDSQVPPESGEIAQPAPTHSSSSAIDLLRQLRLYAKATRESTGRLKRGKSKRSSVQRSGCIESLTENPHKIFRLHENELNHFCSNLTYTMSFLGSTLAHIVIAPTVFRRKIANPWHDFDALKERSRKKI